MGEPAPKPKKKPLFLKQPQMRRVCYALLPIWASAIYFFGWRCFAVVAVVLATGLTTEYLTGRYLRKGPISQACFVTCLLFGLSLPPTVPYYVAMVGIVVAILFAKEVFGGFGRNFANPAIVGRAFVYICFPIALTGSFVPAFQGFPGGLAHWSMESAAGPDVVTQASPMYVYREYGEEEFTEFCGYRRLFWGNIGGMFDEGGFKNHAGYEPQTLAAGSMGEGCVPLILLAAAYLLITKTANWRLMLSGFLGVLFANVLFRNVLGFDAPGRDGVPPVLFNLLAGTTLYVLVFMVTDPVSATKQKPAQFAYGGLIGFCMVFMRWKGPFVAAATFAVLFGNMVGPWLDTAAEWWTDRRKRKQAAAEGGAS